MLGLRCLPARPTGALCSTLLPVKSLGPMSSMRVIGSTSDRSCFHFNRRLPRLPPVFALDSDLPRPIHRRSEKLKGSKSLKQWDSLTTKFSAGSNLPFPLLQLPQIIPNARNLLAENESALFAVPWLGMLTGDTSPHIVFNRRLIISSEPR